MVFVRHTCVKNVQSRSPIKLYAIDEHSKMFRKPESKSNAMTLENLASTCSYIIIVIIIAAAITAAVAASAAVIKVMIECYGCVKLISNPIS